MNFRHPTLKPYFHGPWPDSFTTISQKIQKLGIKAARISTKNDYYDLIFYTRPNLTVNSLYISF